MSLLATRFKNRRLELKMSQAEVAEGICKQGRISKIEQGNYSPGSELLYKLARKLNVSLDYFFNEDIIEESTTLVDFKEIVRKMLIEREYVGLKYLYTLEKEKKQKLSLADQIYMNWIETILLFYVDKQEEQAIEKIIKLLEIISKKDLLFLRLNNTLLNFYVNNKDNESYIKRYEILSTELENIQVKGLEEIELILLIKFNYCRYLCITKDKKAMDEVMEAINLCKKYKTTYCLADLTCLLGNLSEGFMDEDRVKKYYERALMLYELEDNEKVALSLEKYIVEKFTKNL